MATYSSDETRLVLDSFRVRLDELERIVSDHAQRFDTLETWWWRRVWFAIDGWPWHDLNGTQRRRFWHRGR
jgi:hypothetical protein